MFIFYLNISAILYEYRALIIVKVVKQWFLFFRASSSLFTTGWGSACAAWLGFSMWRVGMRSCSAVRRNSCRLLHKHLQFNHTCCTAPQGNVLSPSPCCFTFIKDWQETRVPRVCRYTHETGAVCGRVPTLCGIMGNLHWWSWMQCGENFSLFWLPLTPQVAMFNLAAYEVWFSVCLVR